MKIIFNKIKLLKKFNLYTLYGATNKFNLYYSNNKKYFVYKLVKNIKILKILYNITNKKLKLYLNFNIYKLLKLMKVLKSRIDSVLLNSNLFLTLNNARQHIIHKHIALNNKIVINFSRIVNIKDILFINNLNTKTIINTLIYNYFIKSLKINSINNKVFRLFKYRKIIKNIMLSQNYDLINITSCYKNFKIQINNTKDIKNIVNSNILHFK